MKELENYKLYKKVQRMVEHVENCPSSPVMHKMVLNYASLAKKKILTNLLPTKVSWNSEMDFWNRAFSELIMRLW
jgi:hypothetical protein